MLSSAEVDRAVMPLGGRGRANPELELQHKVSDHLQLSFLWLSLSWVSMWGVAGLALYSQGGTGRAQHSEGRHPCRGGCGLC